MTSNRRPQIEPFAPLRPGEYRACCRGEGRTNATAIAAKVPPGREAGYGARPKLLPSRVVHVPAQDSQGSRSTDAGTAARTLSQRRCTACSDGTTSVGRRLLHAWLVQRHRDDGARGVGRGLRFVFLFCGFLRVLGTFVTHDLQLLAMVGCCPGRPHATQPPTALARRQSTADPRELCCVPRAKLDPTLPALVQRGYARMPGRKSFRGS